MGVVTVTFYNELPSCRIKGDKTNREYDKITVTRGSMQIIDKNKDYYDFYQFEFGPVDKTATYDRRGSKVLTEEEFFRHFYKNVPPFYNVDTFSRIHSDEKDGQWYYWKPNNYVSNYVSSLLLEIGSIQYVIELKNTKHMWINKRNSEFIIRGDVSILYKFDEGAHLCPAPVTLTHFHNKNNRYNWRYNNNSPRSAQDIEPDKNLSDYAIQNPILKETAVPSLIPARNFYIALDNYFRSMYNDKTVEIKNSDIDKAINHGFDKKTSFRRSAS